MCKRKREREKERKRERESVQVLSQCSIKVVRPSPVTMFYQSSLSEFSRGFLSRFSQGSFKDPSKFSQSLTQRFPTWLSQSSFQTLEPGKLYTKLNKCKYHHTLGPNLIVKKHEHTCFTECFSDKNLFSKHIQKNCHAFALFSPSHLTHR